MKIQSQNTIFTYENNVISNTICLNNYYIFVSKMQTIFILGIFKNIYFSVFFSNYFFLLFITISLFLLIFLFFIVIIFFIEHVYFMPNIWVLQKQSKKMSRHFMLQMWVLQKHFNKKIIFILWTLCNYFTLNFMFLKFF